MRAAILDLGTNTFNLLIVDIISGGHFKEVFFDRIPVKLGEKGITAGTIAPAAFERGLQALTRHYKNILDHKVDEIHAYATSAIRDAANGNEFLNTVEERFRFRPQVITGKKEAELIYHGVLLAYPVPEHQNVLIMDIGGGSTEFILAGKSRLLWKKSFNLGAARLLEMFRPSDPVEINEVEEIVYYLKSELQPLIEAGSIYNPEILIGSSGAFDTFADLVRNGMPADRSQANKYFSLPLQDFSELHRALLSSTLQERINMPGMPEFRAEMIVLAAILTQFVLDNLPVKQLVQTFYALKEGVVWELMQGKTPGQGVKG